MRLRYVLPIATVVFARIAPACQSDADPPSAGSADAGGPTRDGSPGNETTVTENDAALDGAPDANLTGRTCAELRQLYDGELVNARACNPTSLVNECTAARESALGCGCTTYLNANGVGFLDKIVAEWQAKGCVAVCPEVLCRLVTGGACTGSGKTATCVDTSDR